MIFGFCFCSSIKFIHNLEYNYNIDEKEIIIVFLNHTKCIIIYFKIYLCLIIKKIIYYVGRIKKFINCTFIFE